MELDEETIDKIREAYSLLDEGVCTKISDADCTGCPLKLNRGYCVLSVIWEACHTPKETNP